jgi:hypothetical protein
MEILLAASAGESAYLQIERYWSLLAFSDLKLHGVAFVDVFDLTPRSEATSMEEDILAAIVRLDKAESFLPHYFLDRSSHVAMPPGLIYLGHLLVETHHGGTKNTKFKANGRRIIRNFVAA